MASYSISWKLKYLGDQKSNLKTIVIGRVTTEDNAELLVICETACENIYKDMVNERLASDFQGSIFTPLEKLNLVLNGEKSWPTTSIGSGKRRP